MARKIVREKGLSIDKLSAKRKLRSRHHMNAKQMNSQAKKGGHVAAHGTFKHVAKSATLDSVLHAFGIKKAEYEHAKQAVLTRTRTVPHAR